MPENMTELYNSLSFLSQQEVYDFMLFLLQKQEKGTLLEQRFVKREKRKAALAEFAGSMKELWEGVDALEYQQGGGGAFPVQDYDKGLPLEAPAGNPPSLCYEGPLFL